MRERMRGPIQSEQKPWDKALLAVVLALCLAMFVVAGLDAVRYHISHMPVWLEVLGAAGIALAIYMFHVVMRTNSYATRRRAHPDERGHQVISTGPYAFVRHPMYSGAILYFLGIALLLGSWYAAGIAVALIALFGLRAVWEENTLNAELPGYADYAAARALPAYPGRLVGAHPPALEALDDCEQGRSLRSAALRRCATAGLRAGASELAAGGKPSHWMWFIFPQIAGLGSSAMAQRYAIASRAEAAAYLDHLLLGPRLRECTRLVTGIDGRSIHEIFGSPDDMKFQSSMTLFARAAGDNADFLAALDKYFDGTLDPATLARL